MGINQLLDLLNYGIKYYKNPEIGNRFTVFEYYAITDINPKDLAKVAQNLNKSAIAIALREFREKNFWPLRELVLEDRLNWQHSIKDRLLTSDDKLSIYKKLKEEGYPLVNGVYDMAARYYVCTGMDSLSKDVVRGQIIEAYCKAKDIPNNFGETNSNEKPKILLKK